MRFRSAVQVARPPAAVFAVYQQVEGWPRWTASVAAVERLDAGPLRVGARARVVQPRLPVAEWVVTELVPGERFSWESRRPGLRTTGRHLVRPAGDGGSLVVAELEHRGLLAPLVGALTAGITRRYLRLETAGLKAWCEGA